jgi:hypothetical protein
VIKISSFALNLTRFLLNGWLGTLWASIGGVPCAIFVDEENGATMQKFMCCVFGRDQILLVRNFAYRNTQRREGPMASLPGGSPTIRVTKSHSPGIREREV